MAKGWGSKSVEALAGIYDVRVNGVERNVPDTATLNQIRQKESILLSRTRIVTELKSAQNPRYRDLLNRSLADLEAKLSTL
jgi:hypothetical protein